jgi:hypothetical protein
MNNEEKFFSSLVTNLPEQLELAAEFNHEFLRAVWATQAAIAESPVLGDPKTKFFTVEDHVSKLYEGQRLHCEQSLTVYRDDGSWHRVFLNTLVSHERAVYFDLVIAPRRRPCAYREFFHVRDDSRGRPEIILMAREIVELIVRVREDTMASSQLYLHDGFSLYTAPRQIYRPA